MRTAFDSGDAEFWVVDESVETVRVYRRVDGVFERVSEFSNGGTITTPILAGFALDVHDVFRA